MKKIIVIKIGSSVLMTKRNEFDEFRISSIAKQTRVLQDKGFGVILVISGAVSYGSNFIDLVQADSMVRQAAAGIGQIYLSSTCNRLFSQAKLQLAQILLTKNTFKNSSEKKKLKNLIEFYITSGFITFINENDVIDLNSFGGNDLLAAEIAGMLHAKELVILSTMQGGVHSIGGGKTKQEAIDILAKENIMVAIVNGKTKDVLTKIL